MEGKIYRKTNSEGEVFYRTIAKAVIDENYKIEQSLFNSDELVFDSMVFNYYALKKTGKINANGGIEASSSSKYIDFTAVNNGEIFYYRLKNEAETSLIAGYSSVNESEYVKTFVTGTGAYSEGYIVIPSDVNYIRCCTSTETINTSFYERVGLWKMTNKNNGVYSTYANGTLKETTFDYKKMIGLSDLTLSGFTRNSQTGKLTSTAEGITYYAKYGYNLCEDSFYSTVKFKSTNTGDFKFGFGKNSSIRGTFVSISKEGANSYLRYYYFAGSSLTEVISLAKLLPFDLQNNTNYRLTVEKYTLPTNSSSKLKVEIITEQGDYHTEIINMNEYAVGWAYGEPYLSVITGVLEISDFTFSYVHPKNGNVKLLIFGDSFIDGQAIKDGKASRYAALLQKRLGYKNVIAMGFGGETTSSVLSRFYKQVDFYSNAEYAMLSLITNDIDLTTFSNNITTMVNYLKSKNIKPILVTGTYRADNPTYNTNLPALNEFIRNSGELYVDFEKAVSENSTWKINLVCFDGVHPNVEGNLIMYNKILMDVPELFW